MANRNSPAAKPGIRLSRRVPLQIRFFRFIGKDFIPLPLTKDFDPGTDCWPWYGATSSQGYALIWQAAKSNRGKHVYGHIFSWEYFNGPVPKDRIIEITCENKSCSNPRHLKPMTRSGHAKTRLRINRKTVQFGEKNGKSKVTDVEVRLLRKLHEERRFADITEFARLKQMTKEGAMSIARARGRARRGKSKVKYYQ